MPDPDPTAEAMIDIAADVRRAAGLIDAGLSPSATAALKAELEDKAGELEALAESLGTLDNDTA